MSSLPSPWARAARAIPIADAAAGSLLFLLNIAVIFPFLMMDFSSEPWNNDYIYIGMTRMFRDHAWTWNALEHGGAPFRYLYPPIFHLLSAAAPFASLGRSFHLVSGLGYALLPVAVYAAARQLFRSRVAAGVAGLLYGVAPSPIYYLLPAWGSLAVKFHHAPWDSLRWWDTTKRRTRSPRYSCCWPWRPHGATGGRGRRCWVRAFY
jgi:hypothetical protein